MDSVGQVASAFNGRVLKEPRGFIKIIQFFVAIFAFATTTSFSSTTKFSIQCTNTTKTDVEFSYSYPFDLYGVGVQVPICNSSVPAKSQTLASLNESEASAAQFYVFVGVIVFLYCIAGLILYLFFDDLYHRNDRVVIIDFVITAVVAVLWLISSSAWAQGVSNLKFYTDPEASGYFQTGVKECLPNKCAVTQFGNFAGLNVSLIFGFLNVIVWGGNLWFLYKETPWFKARSETPATTPSQAGPPTQQPPTNQY